MPFWGDVRGYPTPFSGLRLVMWPVTLRASWVASTKRCKDAGFVHSGAMDETEDAAARRVLAGQEARERCRSHHECASRVRRARAHARKRARGAVSTPRTAR